MPFTCPGVSSKIVEPHLHRTKVFLGRAVARLSLCFCLPTLVFLSRGEPPLAGFCWWGPYCLIVNGTEFTVLKRKLLFSWRMGHFGLAIRGSVRLSALSLSDPGLENVLSLCFLTSPDGLHQFILLLPLQESSSGCFLGFIVVFHEEKHREKGYIILFRWSPNVPKRILIKVQKQFNRWGKSFSTNDAGTVGHPQAKKKNRRTTENLNLNLTLYTHTHRKKPLNRSHTEM